MQYAVLDRTGVLKDSRETKSRSHGLKGCTGGEEFHHRCRRYDMIRPITINHLTRVEVLHQHGHIRLPGERVACQEIDR